MLLQPVVAQVDGAPVAAPRVAPSGRSVVAREGFEPPTKGL